MKSEPERSRGGRTGRKNTVTLRVNDRLADQLRMSADRELRSVASEAELRLARTFEFEKVAGDPKVAAILNYVTAASGLAVQQNGGSLAAGGEELENELAGIFIQAANRFYRSYRKVRSEENPTGFSLSLAQAIVDGLDYSECKLVKSLLEQRL